MVVFDFYISEPPLMTLSLYGRCALDTMGEDTFADFFRIWQTMAWGPNSAHSWPDLFLVQPEFNTTLKIKKKIL